jgi:hypothetical protein
MFLSLVVILIIVLFVIFNTMWKDNITSRKNGNINNITMASDEIAYPEKFTDTTGSCVDINEHPINTSIDSQTNVSQCCTISTPPIIYKDQPKKIPVCNNVKDSRPRIVKEYADIDRSTTATRFKHPMDRPTDPFDQSENCPICGSPTKARKSKRTDELYFGCTNYPNCHFKGCRSH